MQGCMFVFQDTNIVGHGCPMLINFLQNVAGICKMSISKIESLSVEQFSDVTLDMGMGSTIGVNSGSPTLRSQEIASASTPSENDEGGVPDLQLSKIAENDSIEIVQTRIDHSS